MLLQQVIVELPIYMSVIVYLQTGPKRIHTDFLQLNDSYRFVFRVVYTLQDSFDVMTSAYRGGAVNRPGCGIWFTDCEGVGSKGGRRGFLLGGPRRFLAALNVQVYAQCDKRATDLR